MTTRNWSELLPMQNPGVPLRTLAVDASTKTFRSATGLLSRAWRWIEERKAARTNTKRLRVSETVSLGEKRFVAVVHIDGLQFLLGGGPTNVSLLAQLTPGETFGSVLKETEATPASPKPKRARKPSTSRSKVQPGGQA
jgi:hypothetical protein